MLIFGVWARVTVEQFCTFSRGNRYFADGVGVVTVVNQLEVSASQVLLGRCLCEFPKVVFVSILALLNRSIDEASYVAVLLILGGSDEVFARVVTIGNFISVLNLALGVVYLLVLSFHRYCKAFGYPATVSGCDYIIPRVLNQRSSVL